jgi:hypothetical protein
MRFMIILRAIRAIIPYLLERCWGLNSDTARRLGSVLSQGVEFAFVLLATDVIQGVISEPIANLLTLAVTLLMAPDRDSRSNGYGWQSQFSVVAGPGFEPAGASRVAPNSESRYWDKVRWLSASVSLIARKFSLFRRLGILLVSD